MSPVHNPVFYGWLSFDIYVYLYTYAILLES